MVSAASVPIAASHRPRRLGSTDVHLPVLRWGQPYDSLEKDEVVHFSTGEPIATVSRANGGVIQPDVGTGQRGRARRRWTPTAVWHARALTGRPREPHC